MIPGEKNKYDIIIAGGGAAGLSLAYRLGQSSLSGLKVLVIDKDPKKTNDRTWSFWTRNNPVFPEIVYRSWDRLLVKTASADNIMDIHPYKYQMIRGIDFYNHVRTVLSENPNIMFITEEIVSVRSTPTEVTVTTNKDAYHSGILFNSLPAPIPEKIPGKKNFLLQHFKGYILETAEKAFKDDLVRFMDFNVRQENETRFGYVLPFNENTALVEFTVFSDCLLNDPEYDLLLKNYIQSNLQIHEYHIKEVEFGIIPMTDVPFLRKEGERIYNIGSRGGMTKASTGYTFKRIQDECDHIVKSLEKTYPRIVAQPSGDRFRFYDSVLLHVLAGTLYPADEVFSTLFTRNKPQKILKFLEEKTNIFEDLQVLLSLPYRPFMKGAYWALFKRGTKKNRAKYSLDRFLKK